MQLSEFDQSRHYLMKAGRLSPGNTEIRRELEKLNRYVCTVAALPQSSRWPDTSGQ